MRYTSNTTRNSLLYFQRTTKRFESECRAKKAPICLGQRSLVPNARVHLPVRRPWRSIVAPNIQYPPPRVPSLAMRQFQPAKRRTLAQSRAAEKCSQAQKHANSICIPLRIAVSERLLHRTLARLPRLRTIIQAWLTRLVQTLWARLHSRQAPRRRWKTKRCLRIRTKINHGRRRF
jgi:hypothetical protein